jgi:hypothetical protein
MIGCRGALRPDCGLPGRPYSQSVTLYAMLKEELEFVRYRIKEYYDKSWLEGPRLIRGDKVYLISRNLRIKRLSKKLDFKKLRPFKINECIS